MNDGSSLLAPSVTAEPPGRRAACNGMMSRREHAIWRTATGAHHVDLQLPNGFHLHLDSVALAKSFDGGWPEVPGAGTKTVIGVAVASREDVDERYQDLVGAGYTGRQPPYDTFWGATRR
jgi:uncharacterized glyoxalase superfamily protein PhnB